MSDNDGASWMLPILRNDDAKPEQRLAAAVIIVAMRDAGSAGIPKWMREDATDFLATRRCKRWIGAVCGDADIDTVQRAILAHVRQTRPYAERQLMMEGCV